MVGFILSTGKVKCIDLIISTTVKIRFKIVK